LAGSTPVPITATVTPETRCQGPDSGRVEQFLGPRRLAGVRPLRRAAAGCHPPGPGPDQSRGEKRASTAISALTAAPTMSPSCRGRVPTRPWDVPPTLGQAGHDRVADAETGRSVGLVEAGAVVAGDHHYALVTMLYTQHDLGGARRASWCCAWLPRTASRTAIRRAAGREPSSTSVKTSRARSPSRAISAATAARSSPRAGPLSRCRGARSGGAAVPAPGRARYRATRPIARPRPARSAGSFGGSQGHRLQRPVTQCRARCAGTGPAPRPGRAGCRRPSPGACRGPTSSNTAIATTSAGTSETMSATAVVTGDVPGPVWPPAKRNNNVERNARHDQRHSGRHTARANVNRRDRPRPDKPRSSRRPRPSRDPARRDWRRDSPRTRSRHPR